MHISKATAASMIILFIVLLTGEISHATEHWTEPYYPYCVELKLNNPRQGPVVIDLNIDSLLKSIAEVAVDVTDIDNFAFEKAILVDPESGKKVGEFKLFPEKTQINIDGDFKLLASGQRSPWLGYSKTSMTIEPVKTDGQNFNALFARREKFANVKMRQKLELKPDDFYLLEYMVYNDTTAGVLHAGLYNPQKRLFANLHKSYQPLVDTMKKWTKKMTLFRSDITTATLDINMTYIGRCGIGDMSLRKANWKLIGDLPEKRSSLMLYCIMRVGHRFPVITPSLIQTSIPANTVAATIENTQLQNLNPNGVLVKSGNVEAWTIPSDYPLIVETIAKTIPANHDAKTVETELFRGGNSTIIIALKTGAQKLDIVKAECNLPLKAGFKELAEIPVYDGPSPTGKLIQTRLDAMVPLNYPLIPEVKNGIHLVAVTLTAEPDMKPGKFAGSITLELKSSDQQNALITVPVNANVIPPVIKPVQHFGTIFLAHYFIKKFNIGKNQAKSIAEFHGYTNCRYDTKGNITFLDQNQAAKYGKRSIRRLARNYYHTLLDYQISTANIATLSPFTYQVVDQGENKAPLLENWDFKEYDTALDEFKNKELPYILIQHTNGKLVTFLRLANGITYSLKPALQGNKFWRQLPEKEFYKLIRDYFNGIAKHLADKGFSGRPYILIDESLVTDYDAIRDYIKAVKSGTYGRNIQIAYTDYRANTYITRGTDGKLLLDGYLDLHGSDNDEYMNFLEPEYGKLFKDPNRQQWVYYVETDHFNLQNAGISTIITPLKLRNFGARGWICWAAFIWSIPYPVTDTIGPEYVSGPVINPWVNPFYHHGPGVLSFFYPPDPKGVSETLNDTIIPSYRLALMRDGLELYALLDVLERGRDDAGNQIKVDAKKLNAARNELKKLWTTNTVQWYISYNTYRKAKKLLYDAVQ